MTCTPPTCPALHVEAEVQLPVYKIKSRTLLAYKLDKMVLLVPYAVSLCRKCSSSPGSYIIPVARSSKRVSGMQRRARGVITRWELPAGHG